MRLVRRIPILIITITTAAVIAACYWTPAESTGSVSLSVTVPEGFFQSGASGSMGGLVRSSSEHDEPPEALAEVFANYDGLLIVWMVDERSLSSGPTDAARLIQQIDDSIEEQFDQFQESLDGIFDEIEDAVADGEIESDDDLQPYIDRIEELLQNTRITVNLPDARFLGHFIPFTSGQSGSVVFSDLDAGARYFFMVEAASAETIDADVEERQSYLGFSVESVEGGRTRTVSLELDRSHRDLDDFLLSQYAFNPSWSLGQFFELEDGSTIEINDGNESTTFPLRTAAIIDLGSETDAYGNEFKIMELFLYGDGITNVDGSDPGERVVALSGTGPMLWIDMDVPAGTTIDDLGSQDWIVNFTTCETASAPDECLLIVGLFGSTGFPDDEPLQYFDGAGVDNPQDWFFEGHNTVYYADDLTNISEYPETGFESNQLSLVFPTGPLDEPYPPDRDWDITAIFPN